RPVEPCDETILARVPARCEDDRNCGRRRLGREYGRKRACENHSHLTANQVGRKLWQSIVLILRPTIFDRHVLALDKSGFLEALAECGHEVGPIGKRSTVEETDHRHCLRPRRERPRRCAAQQRDERAALHVWMAPAWQEIIWRAAQRPLAVMCPACWCSPDGLLALMGSANRVLIIRTGSMSR